MGKYNHGANEIYRVNVGDREGVAVKHLNGRTDYVFDENGVGVRLEEAEIKGYEVMRENIRLQIEQLRTRKREEEKK